MAYSLRRFQPADLFSLNLTNLDPLTENYDLRFYIQYLAKWPSLFICATNAKGHIIGYIMGKLESDPQTHIFSPHYLPWHGHITALTVAPTYRRLGIARRLCEALEHACNAQDAWFVDLFVRAGNDTAIEMYKRMGYSVYRRVVGYYTALPGGGGKKGGGGGDGAEDEVEDAFDMRKAGTRKGSGRHVREGGEGFLVEPEDVYR